MRRGGDRGTRRLRRVLSTGLLVAPIVLVPAALTGSASADTAPASTSTPATVAADPLPTVQVDGVVWSQAVVGDVVYAGGKFTTARPAGAAPGVSTTARNNLLAYNIKTGALVTSFAPNLNGQVLAVTPSPDGSRIYVAGEFTLANGAKRYRIAAYSTATGALVTTFAPTLDFRARAVVAVGSTVYVGGAFSSANGNPRKGLAAFSATNGALLNWAPAAEGGQVMAMVQAPGQSKIVVGGQFSTISGTAAYGMGAVDATTGAVQPWAANTVVRNAGADGAVNSLTVDGSKVFGTGYDFGLSANFEGAFAADPATGRIIWLEDCHGDTYSSSAIGGVLYTASHAHFCGNVGGFPETSPRTHSRALAFTTDARGTVAANTEPGYPSFAKQPAPGLLTWWPLLAAGTYTGQNQAAWSVNGNRDYVVMGGEFPTANGVAQQGLVRYAAHSVATGKQAPIVKGAALNPALLALERGTVRVSWPANWDRDNEHLTYKVYRDGNLTTPVFQTTAASTFWRRPTLGFTDRGRVPGQRYTYRLFVSDPLGNTVSSEAVSAAAGAGTATGTYARNVLDHGAGTYWRLGESAGTKAYDWAGVDDATLGTGVTRGAAGAVPDNAASTFDGTANGTAAGTQLKAAPNTMTVEAWVKTTSVTGGRIVGFGNRSAGTSSAYDRHVYMDNTGRLTFGVSSGGLRTITGPTAYNDGRWHHVVATLGSDGMGLYVDGAQVGRNTAVTSGAAYSGYWRVGGDNLTGWASKPTSSYLAGAIDEVAVYPRVLTATEVKGHADSAAEVAAPANTAPSAAFTSTSSGLTGSLDGRGSTDSDGTIASYAWTYGDGASGTGATSSHTYAAAGSYPVTLTVTDDGGAKGTVTKTVTVTAPAPAPAQPAAYATDTFSRTVTGGFGTADVGGAWSVLGGAANFAVSGGTGRVTMAAAGSGPAGYLQGVSSADTELRSSVALDKAQTGGGTYVSFVGRRVGTAGDYRLRLRYLATGEVTASWNRMVAGTETVISSVTVPGITYAPGEVLQVRLQVAGTAPTTMQAKVWRKGATEPAAWLLAASDTTADLQAAGSVGVVSYLSGSSTSAPVVATYDDLSAGPRP